MITGFIAKGGNYCPVFNEWINDHLVNSIRPECIKRYNGCANCPFHEYRLDIQPIIKKKYLENKELGKR